MRLISFDPLRTLSVPGVRPCKPTDWFRRRDDILAADWLLFPEYWQVNALVYAWKKRIFPSISSYHLGHDKIEMTRAFEACCPANVLQTLILPATPAGIEEALDTFDCPMVAKVVRSSMGQGVQLIESRSALQAFAAKNDILYLQEYLPIRRDLRVVWVGDRVVSAYWREAPEGGFLNNVAQGGSVSFENIPDTALTLVHKIASSLGINHAGFDIALLDGHCYLLEFNLRFGTHALNRQGIRLEPIIHEYLANRTDLAQEPDFTLPSAG